MSAPAWRKSRLTRRPWITRSAYPDGYVYLPDGTPDEWIKQLVAEELRIIRLRNGGFRNEWHKTRDRNEALDNAVYARAVAFSLGVDRWTEAHWAKVRGENERPVEIVVPPKPTVPASRLAKPGSAKPITKSAAPAGKSAPTRKPNPFTTRRR